MTNPTPPNPFLASEDDPDPEGYLLQENKLHYSLLPCFLEKLDLSYDLDEICDDCEPSSDIQKQIRLPLLPHYIKEITLELLSSPSTFHCVLDLSNLFGDIPLTSLNISNSCELSNSFLSFKNLRFLGVDIPLRKSIIFDIRECLQLEELFFASSLLPRGDVISTMNLPSNLKKMALKQVNINIQNIMNCTGIQHICMQSIFCQHKILSNLSFFPKIEIYRSQISKDFTKPSSFLFPPEPFSCISNTLREISVYVNPIEFSSTFRFPMFRCPNLEIFHFLCDNDSQRLYSFDFPLSLVYSPKLSSLQFSYLKFESIPKELETFQELTVFRLCSCLVTSFDADISTLKNLKAFQFSPLVVGLSTLPFQHTLGDGYIPTPDGITPYSMASDKNSILSQNDMVDELSLLFPNINTSISLTQKDPLDPISTSRHGSMELSSMSDDLLFNLSDSGSASDSRSPADSTDINQENSLLVNPSVQEFFTHLQTDSIPSDSNLTHTCSSTSTTSSSRTGFHSPRLPSDEIDFFTHSDSSVSSNLGDFPLSADIFSHPDSLPTPKKKNSYVEPYIQVYPGTPEVPPLHAVSYSNDSYTFEENTVLSSLFSGNPGDTQDHTTKPSREVIYGYHPNISQSTPFYPIGDSYDPSEYHHPAQVHIGIPPGKPFNLPENLKKLWFFSRNYSITDIPTSVREYGGCLCGLGCDLKNILSCSHLEKLTLRIPPDFRGFVAIPNNFQNLFLHLQTLSVFGVKTLIGPPRLRFPPNFLLPCRVKSLIILACNLTKVGDYLQEATQLEYLDLSQNLIIEVPGFLLDLPNLHFIKLVNNQISQIHVSSNFKDIVQKRNEADFHCLLNLNENPLQKIPQILSDNSTLSTSLLNIKHSLSKPFSITLYSTLYEDNLIHLSI